MSDNAVEKLVIDINGSCRVREHKIGFAAVAEERQEIRDDPVDRLDDPGEVEDRQIGSDLGRGPPETLFQIVVERLGDQAAGLADPFDDVDQTEEQHEPTDLPVLFRPGEGTLGRPRLAHAACQWAVLRSAI